MHIFAWSPNPYAPKNRRRPMVTPVHRLQHIDSMLMDPRGRFDRSAPGRYGRGRRWGNRTRLPRHTEEVEISRPRNAEASSAVATTQVNETNTENSSPPHRPIFPNNFNRFRMGGINWALWGCFIVITALLVPAHIYLKKYTYRGELMGIFFVITLLFLVCFSVSMFHTKTRTILLHRLHLEEQMNTCPRSPSNNQCQQFTNIRGCQDSANNMQQARATVSASDLQLIGDTRVRIEEGHRYHQNRSNRNVSRSVSQTSGSDASSGWDLLSGPPPYEVAVLLPTPSTENLTIPCETPPPPYDVVQ